MMGRKLIRASSSISAQDQQPVDLGDNGTLRTKNTRAMPHELQLDDDELTPLILPMHYLNQYVATSPLPMTRP
jgi:hypothetical protein